MYMTERFGAWQVGNDERRGAVEFKLFFPDRARDPSQYEARRFIEGEGGRREVPNFGEPRIDSIQVAGTFQSQLGQTDWDFATAPQLERKPHAKGWVWSFRTPTELPADFYEYKYRLRFGNGEERILGDPCSRYGGKSDQNSAFVIGGSDPAVRQLKGPWMHLRDLVIYELMIDDFTNEFRAERAPIDAVRDKLDHLADDIGVNAILFMPWTAWWDERFNWGYDPYQYFSVEYRYANALGKPAEKLSWLKRLVSECHDRGIHVIMDGVFNHVSYVRAQQGRGFPYFWMYENPDACPYVGRFGGEFAGLSDLDFHNGCTREFIRDVCFYWIDEFRIDGIRFDNTTNFFVANEDRGLPQLLREIREHVADRGENNFSLTLEHLDMSAASVANQTGATSYWNNELYQRCFDYLWSGRIDSRIMGALNTHIGLPPERVPTTYIGNHDHSHVAWQAGATESAGALRWWRTQPYAIGLFTAPGAVMIQNGQELGEDYWLMENDEGSNRRVKPRPLRWDCVGDKIGRELMRLYSKLIRIRKAHSGLRSPNFYPGWETWQTQFNAEGYGVDVARQLVIFHRWGSAGNGRLERFIIVLNLSNNSHRVDIPFSENGVWRDLLNDRDDNVVDFRLRDQEITSNWGRVYFLRS
jgi:pullulanase/glycogen debranching enzyme